MARRLRGDQGVSTLELALLAPLLVGMLLMMTDVGFAVQQRMTMDHILRLGAEAAMRGANEAQIAEALAAAVQDHATERMDGLQVAAPQLLCLCPETGDAAVSCEMTCASDVAPDRYISVSAAMPYRSIVMGGPLGVTLRSRLMVQVLPDFGA